MTESFTEKVALITGAASGIGRATALALAARGCSLILADHNLEGAEETADHTGVPKESAIAVQVDVTEDTQVAAMVRTAQEHFGRLDIAVNSAGVGGVSAHITEYPEEVWQKVLDVNLTGVWRCMKHQIAAMDKGGSIVNLSSAAGLEGFPGHSGYAASKWGVVGLTKTAALEWVRQGIRVNAICPAFTETPMVQEIRDHNPKLGEKLTRMIPMKRLGTVEEIAAAIVFLCSDAASFITGHALPVDGGMTT